MRPCGTTNWIVRDSWAPHWTNSIINPFRHFSTSSARFITQLIVISSFISCVSSSGNVSVVILFVIHVFKMFLRPMITGCRLDKSGSFNVALAGVVGVEFGLGLMVLLSGSVFFSLDARWNITCPWDILECLLMKKSPMFMSLNSGFKKSLMSN